jgi:hypothetical protein
MAPYIVMAAAIASAAKQSTAGSVNGAKHRF